MMPSRVRQRAGVMEWEWGDVKEWERGSVKAVVLAGVKTAALDDLTLEERVLVVGLECMTTLGLVKVREKGHGTRGGRNYARARVQVHTEGKSRREGLTECPM